MIFDGLREDGSPLPLWVDLLVALGWAAIGCCLGWLAWIVAP